ncbi:MAG: hypothetical protein GY943_35835 [Chloroflexi bacterium]|nr:hypothetical protein [Chloroflexota bacterium]
MQVGVDRGKRPLASTAKNLVAAQIRLYKYRAKFSPASAAATAPMLPHA